MPLIALIAVASFVAARDPRCAWPSSFSQPVSVRFGFIVGDLSECFIQYFRGGSKKGGHEKKPSFV